MKRTASLLLAVLTICSMMPFAAVTVAAGDYFGGLDERLDGPAAPSGLTPTAPTSKGGNDGTIGGVTTDMEYSIDNGENWIPVTESPITGLTPGKVLVRVAGTATVKPSASAEVTVPDYSGAPGKANGPAAPDVTPVAPTRENETDGKVTGVDETMEYSTDGGTTWKPVTGTSITGFISGTNVTVRVKETETKEAGASKVVVIPDFVKGDGPAAPGGLSATAPTSKNGTDGRVLGVDATMEYSIDGGATWKPVTGTEIGGFTRKTEVKVRAKETDTAKAGVAVTITIPDHVDNDPGKADGPAAPTGLGATAPTSKDGTDGKVLGVDTTMEYSIDGGAIWKPVTGTEITELAGKTNVTVRVKATDITNAGAAATVVIPEFVKADGPAAPGGLSATAPTSKNGTDGRVLGVDATMEYSIDGGATWKPVTGTEIGGFTRKTEVKVRAKETDSTKAGAIATVTVPEYWDIPENVIRPINGDNRETNNAADNYQQNGTTGSDSILSNGNWWIIIAVAVLALGGVAALVIVKKKKKSALADGESKDEE